MRFLSISIRALRRLELVMCIGGRYSVVVGTGRINPRFLQLISICHVTSSFGSLLVLSSLIYDCVTSARQQQPVGCCFDAACLFVCLFVGKMVTVTVLKLSEYIDNCTEITPLNVVLNWGK